MHKILVKLEDKISNYYTNVNIIKMSCIKIALILMHRNL